MNRRGFLKGVLGAGAATVAAPKVLAAEGKAKKVMEQTEFDKKQLSDSEKIMSCFAATAEIGTTYCVCFPTSSDF